MKRLNKFTALILRGASFTVVLSLAILTTACVSSNRGQTDPNLTSGGGFNIPNAPTFGDDFTGGDFNIPDTILGDDFQITQIEDDPIFNVDNPSDDLQNDCTSADMFPNAGSFTDPTTIQNLSCIDSSVFGDMTTPDSTTTSPLHLMLTQGLFSFSYMNQCFQLAIALGPQVQQNPELGFDLAMIGIANCYQRIYRQNVGGSYWARHTAHRQQSFEPKWIRLMEKLMQ